MAKIVAKPIQMSTPNDGTDFEVRRDGIYIGGNLEFTPAQVREIVRKTEQAADAKRILDRLTEVSGANHTAYFNNDGDGDELAAGDMAVGCNIIPLTFLRRVAKHYSR